MIIGFGHRKRSGKDTAGEYLTKKYGFTRMAFAQPLKEAAMSIFGFTYEQCYGEEAIKEAVDARWGFSPRQAMQTLGETMRNVFGQDVWIKSVIEKINRINQQSVIVVKNVEENKIQKIFSDLMSSDHSVLQDHHVVSEYKTTVIPSIVITDVRYPNEAEAIRKLGGIVVRIDRPSLGASTDSHPSETSMNSYEYDEVILNDGTLEAFYESIDRLILLYRGSK